MLPFNKKCWLLYGKDCPTCGGKWATLVARLDAEKPGDAERKSWIDRVQEEHNVAYAEQLDKLELVPKD